MPKTIEYSVFSGSESGNVLTEIAKRTIQPREALVQITHAGLCGADKLSKTKNIPLGHHGAGIVRDVGCAVQYVKIGDRVGFNGSQIACGNCGYCIGGVMRFNAFRVLADTAQAKSSTARSAGVARKSGPSRRTPYGMRTCSSSFPTVSSRNTPLPLCAAVQLCGRF